MGNYFLNRHYAYMHDLFYEREKKYSCTGCPKIAERGGKPKYWKIHQYLLINILWAWKPLKSDSLSNPLFQFAILLFFLLNKASTFSVKFGIIDQ